MEYYNDGQVTIHQGSCLDILPDLGPESVQCVVTSPPYWGLRKYAGEQEFVWGMNGHCKHEWGADILADTRHESFKDWGNAVKEGRPIPEAPHIKISQGAHCVSCSAWRGAYGLEPTPEMYVDHTVEILREIRRVLRPDGVVFWNIGDSYASNTKDGGRHDTDKMYPGNPDGLRAGKSFKLQHGLKTKDLCLIPARIQLAAQADGWWVRSVIIWSKPNPMPESVKDRPTESHEYIIMLTKSARYYWDMDAVREPQTGNAHSRGAEANSGAYQEQRESYHGFRSPSTEVSGGRNIRSVWEFPTQPYPEAHFAVFPEKLPERCILAATSEKGNCSKCGKPWVRITEKKRTYQSGSGKAGNKPQGKWIEQEECTGSLEDDIRAGPCVSTKTVGWKPQCSCGVEPEPAIVLDPFSGAGTTLWVAKRLGRKGIGIDVSGDYCGLAVERSRQLAIQFAYQTLPF